jgi:hypothetical protein
MHALLSIEQVPPWIGQYEGSEQVVTKSAWQIGKYGVDVHAPPVTEQVWPVFGQLLSCVHDVRDVLQCPAIVPQFASTVQAVVVDTEHVPGSTGHSAGSLPAVWHTEVVVILQWPAVPQLASTVQARPSVEQVAPTTRHCGSLVQDIPLRLHVPFRTQAVSLKHEPWSMLHCPGWVGHSAGSVPVVWQIAFVNVQRASSGHCALAPGIVQVLLSVLQCPAMVGQSVSSLQAAVILVLQCPADAQSLATMQVAGITEHVPASVGHSAGSEPDTLQALPPMLQVPVLGQSEAVPQLAPLLLHFPGGQVVTRVQAGHSSPVQGQTSGGTHDVVQVAGFGGMQVGATRLQTWDLTLLHAWPVMPVQVCGVTPLHDCGDVAGQLWVPMLMQVCGVAGTQVCAAPPPQVCGSRF